MSTKSNTLAVSLICFTLPLNSFRRLANFLVQEQLSDRQNSLENFFDNYVSGEKPDPTVPLCFAMYIDIININIYSVWPQTKSIFCVINNIPAYNFPCNTCLQVNSLIQPFLYICCNIYTFPCKICQSDYIQVNSLIQPFLYFAINRRLREDLIHKIQLCCCSRDSNDASKVPSFKLTNWQASPSFNTDVSMLVDICNVSINCYCYQLYPIWKCKTNLSTQRRSNLALDINLCRTKSKKPKERKTRRRWFVMSPRKEAIG